MNFNKHSSFEGQHAFLGASNYHWINYDKDKMIIAYNNFLAKQRGTELHDFARRCIELGIKLPNNKQTLNMYVNDAIGFRMQPEVLLYYSDNSFGTADAISFKKNFLRIHDLKSGVITASMHQLEVYVALFCLEYRMKPDKIKTELRIYQSNDILIEEPEPEYISYIMEKIIESDKLIEQIKKGDILI